MNHHASSPNAKQFSETPLFLSKPFEDLFKIKEQVPEEAETREYAFEFCLFHTHAETLVNEYLYGGFYKTLLEYESDWDYSLWCIQRSKFVFDHIHPRKTKEGYLPHDQAVLDSVRGKLRELGDVRGIILKHQQRIWRGSHGK